MSAADTVLHSVPRRSVRADSLLALSAKILLFAILIVCVIYPIIWVIAGSFRAGDDWTLAHYHEAFSSFYLRVIGTTLVYAVASVALSLVLGLPLAWLLARSDMPFKGFIRGCTMITFVMPPLFHAIAYVFLFQPRAGLVNQALNEWFGVQPFNIYTLTGMVVVTALGLFPQTVLLVEAALQNIDPSLEEAAATAGASPNQVTRKIILPVVLPAISSSAVLGFIEVIGVFGPPAVIGIPARIYVMSTQIFADLSGFPPKFEFAAAVAMIFLVIVAFVLLLQDRLLRSGAYTTVSGKGFRARPVRLRRWKPVALGCAFLLVLVGVGIPAIVLVGISMSKVWSAGLSLSNLTLEFYHEALFGGDRMMLSFVNTLILAVCTSIATLVIGLQIAMMTANGGSPGARLARIIAFLPFSIPAVVFTLGVILAYIRPPLALYGTLWIILICYFGRFLPFAVQPLSDGLRQIDRSLVEAGRVVGSGAFSNTARIVLPLLKFATASTALLVFVACIREIVSIALLFSPRTETLMMTAILVWAEGQVQLTAAIVVLLVVAVLVLFAAARLALRMRPLEKKDQGGFNMSLRKALLFGVLAIGVAQPGNARAQDAGLIAKAKAEGVVSYYGIGPATTLRQLGEAFTKQYGIKVEAFVTGGVQVAQKIQLELMSGRVSADVVEVGDSSIIMELAKKGAIASFTPPGADKLPKGLVSPDGLWIGIARNTYPIIYNKKLVSEADAPKSYKDLADPKWKDKLVVASPNYGSSQLVFVKGLTELGGWELVEGLKKNNLFIVQGWPEAEQAIATGERHVGVDINVRLATALARGENFGVIYPTEGTIAGVSVLGIMKAAPHPNAARLFAMFRLSQEQQQLLPKVGMYPVIPGAGTPAGLEPIEKLKLHNVDADELAAKANEIKSRWTRTVER